MDSYMAGIIVALIGLGIILVASFSFVQPLPRLGLPTKTRAFTYWLVGGGYIIVATGSGMIRQTFPEEVREPFLFLPMLAVLGAFILSCIALVRPLPKLWLATRGRAGYVLALSLGLMSVLSILLPEPPPPTPEELAAQAAEAERQRTEQAAEERRKAAEERREAAEEVAEKLQSLGEDYIHAAAVRCEDHIEQLAKYDFEWTTRWGERIFSWYTWSDLGTDGATIKYMGDKIRFQNGFGAFSHYTYTCHYDTEEETIIHVSATQGRLPMR